MVESDGDSHPLEEEIGEALLAGSLVLAVAESCTGGMVSARITGVAGSSRYFRGGVVAYSNEVKRGILSVSGETLERFGAVSAETAIEMAQGVRERLGAHLGLSVTGIAGPSGGTGGKPVGTVFIAVCDTRTVSSCKSHFDGNRESVRRKSAGKALELLQEFLQSRDG
ncbi:MAG: CinA family protein [Thermodesulfobacteriota bacterium]